MSKEKLEHHVYELPCGNCKAMVRLTAYMWLKYHRNETLPLCATNGCRKYKKFLSITEMQQNERDHYH